MEKALKNHQDCIQNLAGVEVDVSRFSLKHTISARRKGERSSGKGGMAGGPKDRAKAQENAANFEEGGGP